MPAPSERELSAEDRQRLDDAYRRLRTAVAAYEPYLARDQFVAQGRAAVPLDELARAQAEVEAAEDELWRLREQLLGGSPAVGARRRTRR
jgi:multidrug efflux pump subunit AcrA (membrane-fusion protein)